MHKGKIGDEVRFTKKGLKGLRDDALVDEHEIVDVPKKIVAHIPMDADEWPGYTEISYVTNQGYGITEESEYFAPDEFELVEKVTMEEAWIEFLSSLPHVEMGDLSDAIHGIMARAFRAGWEAAKDA